METPYDDKSLESYLSAYDVAIAVDLCALVQDSLGEGGKSAKQEQELPKAQTASSVTSIRGRALGRKRSATNDVAAIKTEGEPSAETSPLAKRSRYNMSAEQRERMNSAKRLNGDHREIQGVWDSALQEIASLVDASSLRSDLAEELFEPVAKGIRRYRGTRQDTISVASLKTVSNGEITLTIVQSKTGRLYVPLNDFRRRTAMPLRINKCYRLLESLDIAHVALHKFNIDSSSDDYTVSASRTPLISSDIIAYLAKPCTSNCAERRKRCPVPWCWTLRATIDAPIFRDAVVLLASEGFFEH
jgi:hypothetical protein